MINFNIDFETFSTRKIRNTGAPKYIADPASEILCLSFSEDGGPVQRFNREYFFYAREIGCPFPTDGSAIYHAFNASFERAVWYEILHKRYGWPNIPIGLWRCTAARVAQFGWPRSLDNSSIALGCKEQKDKDGHRLMLKVSQPRKPSKHNPATRWLIPEELNKVYLYCDQDVVTEQAVGRYTPTPSAYEQFVWEMDQRINDRGVPIDVEGCRAAIAMRETLYDQLADELSVLTKKQLTSPNQNSKFVEWLNLRGINVGSVDKGNVKHQLEKDDIPDDVRRALEIRKASSRSSLKKFDAMVARAKNGRVHHAHLYFGGHTGRWSGQGVQFQNVPGGKFTPEQVAEAIGYLKSGDAESLAAMSGGDLGTALVNLIRAMVCASPGNRLLVGDFNAIEARVIAWLSGQDDLLIDFRDGKDPYIRMATRIYGGDYDELLARYDSGDSEANDKRKLSKVAVLGLGFQMGAPRFEATCDDWGVDMAGVSAEDTVAVYRESNDKIVKFWWALQDASIQATVSGKPHRAGPIQFERHQRYLFAILPSGRRLAYPDPKVENVEKWGRMRPELSYMGTDQYTRKFVRQKTYGGKLAENITQAVARDFLVEALARLEAKGYPPIFHVHDEAVAEMPYGQGSVTEFIEIMEQRPKWGRSCPIAVEAFEAERYRKD